MKVYNIYIFTHTHDSGQVSCFQSKKKKDRYLIDYCRLPVLIASVPMSQSMHGNEAVSEEIDWLWDFY